MLNENQIKAVHYMADGMNISDIARSLGVCRQTIYDWKEKEEFIAELDRQIQRIKIEADKKLTSNLGRYVGELEKIAFTSKNEKVRLSALTYLIDRVLGRCTTKVDANIDREPTEEINWDDITQLKMVK